MADSPDPHPIPPVVRAGRAPDEGFGLDRIVTAIAFLATVLLILLSPFG